MIPVVSGFSRTVIPVAPGFSRTVIRSTTIAR